jgi:hypothetical protein
MVPEQFKALVKSPAEVRTSALYFEKIPVFWSFGVLNYLAVKIIDKGLTRLL